MRSTMRRRALIVAVLVSAAVAMGVSPGAAQAAPKPYGDAIGDWGGQWWQWAFAQPADATHPLFDETGEQCMNGQSGRGFVLLGGIFNASGTGERECYVPAGRGLFFPAINVECSSLEAGTIFYGDDAESLSACLDAWSYEGSITVDGKSKAVHSGRSGVYPIGPMPAANLLGAAPGATGVSMADGLYGVLPPLSAGHHVVQFEGTARYDGSLGGDSFAFSIAMVYHLHVG